jgi:hypothetical protein
MMIFSEFEVPVAHSMIALVRRKSYSLPPFLTFACYWMAFNNVYVTIADYRRERDGVKKRAKERDQINLAFKELADELKDRLIKHPSLKFFVTRIPRWRGSPVQHGADVREPNGVLKVGPTEDKGIPVLSPIDRAVYEQYVNGQETAAARNSLAKQIVDLLYTVRNNIFHGGKRADDANDREVAEMALPLLKLIVENFLLEMRWRTV